MFGIDRTNSPAVNKPPKDGRISSLPAPGWTEVENNRKAAAASTAIVPSTDQLRVNEELRVLKNQVPNLKDKFEEIMGTEEKRKLFDSEIRVKGKPEERLLPYAKKFLAQETDRWKIGYEKVREQESNLFLELQIIQTKYEHSFETISNFINKLDKEKMEAIYDRNECQKKLKSLEDRWTKEKVETARAKGQLEKESEAVARAREESDEAKLALQNLEKLSQQQSEELRKDLQLCEKKLVEAEQREREARILVEELTSTMESTKIKMKELEEKERDCRKRMESAEFVASSQSKLNSKLSIEIAELQKVISETEKKSSINLETEVLVWKQKLTIAENELDSTVKKYSDIESRFRDSQNEINSLRLDLQRKETQIMEAEKNLNAKDGNMHFALQALTSNLEVLNKDKGRLESKNEEMLAEKNVLVEKLHEANSDRDRLREHELLLNQKVSEMEKKCFDFERRALETEKAHSEALLKLKHVEDESIAKTARFGELKETLEKALDLERNKVSEAAREAKEAKDKAKEAKKMNDELQNELSGTKIALEKLSSSPKKKERILEETIEAESWKRRAGDANQYQEKVEQLTAELALTKKLLFEADIARRTLLNEVQNLKGNIRVVARIRPPTQKATSIPDSETSRITCSIDGTGLTLELRGDQQRRGTTSSSTASEAHAFTYNRIFDKDASQHAIFDEVSQFVQSALDGYNVCLFSYGQTGSGKTWTMTGDLNDHLNKGIIPRSVDHILYTVAQMREKGWTYSIECSYLEIYNEVVRDLLTLDPKAEKTARHDILHRGGDVYVTGIRKVAVQEYDDVQLLLQQAEKNRAVAKTDKNHESSRSHSIFTIYFVGKNKEKDNAELVGSLNLCDLAGSERLKTSGATGDRMKETQAINTSLSALATVFTHLSQKAAHVSYRSSSLTHILSPCLSGEGKTLMIVNLSSDHDDAQESLCSLRFAQNVNKTELGKAKKNIRDASEAATRGRNNSQ